MIRIAVFLLIVFIAPLCTAEECYNVKEIKKYRKEINHEYKKSDKSPLTEKDKRKFKSLKFFLPKEKFSFNATFVEKEKKDTVFMKTSKNDVRTMVRYGTFKFEFEGNTYSLSAFAKASDPNPTSMFVPFTDQTSINGKSYPAGRYLDIEYTKNKTDYCLDFNYAYNPYCAYNDKYSCPLVPLENNIDIEIIAGEKKYNKK